MKDIIINKSNNPKIKYVIFSISTDSPLFLLDEINKNIYLENGQSVLFDQLLQTGDSSNRFLSLKFVNGTFDLSSIQHIDKKQIECSEKEIKLHGRHSVSGCTERRH